MKKHRRILSLALAAVLTLGVMAAPAYAAEPDTATPVESPAPEESTTPEETTTPVEPTEPTQPTEPAEPTGPVVFTDVPADAWYAEAVNALAKGGLIEGDGNGHFNPTGLVTYGEFVAVLGRMYAVDGYKVYDPLPKHLPALGGSYSAYGWRIASVAHYDDTVQDIENGTNHPPAHWAAYWNHMIGTAVMGVVEPEDLDVPVIRGSAIAHIALAAINSKAGAPKTVNSYTPADIPDWNDVRGIKNDFHDMKPGVDKWDVAYVWPIDNELHFLPEGYVADGMVTSPEHRHYNMDSIADNDLNGQTYVIAHPDLVLRAYNMGLTTGVDANHTCNVYGHLTRAELCVMLYRAGLTQAHSLKFPKPANYYEGMHVDLHDEKYYK